MLKFMEQDKAPFTRDRGKARGIQEKSTRVPGDSGIEPSREKCKNIKHYTYITYKINTHE